MDISKTSPISPYRLQKDVLSTVHKYPRTNEGAKGVNYTVANRCMQ